MVRLIVAILFLASLGVAQEIPTAKVGNDTERLVVSRSWFVAFCAVNGCADNAFAYTAKVRYSSGQEKIQTFVVPDGLDPLVQKLVAVHEHCHVLQLTAGQSVEEKPCFDAEISALSSLRSDWKSLLSSPTLAAESVMGRKKVRLRVPDPATVEELMKSLGVSQTSENHRYFTSVMAYAINGAQYAKLTTELRK